MEKDTARDTADGAADEAAGCAAGGESDGTADGATGYGTGCGTDGTTGCATERAAGKRRLRREAFARRRAVDADLRRRSGPALAAALAGSPLRPGRGTTVAAFVSMGTEVEMRPTLRSLLDDGVRLLVPRLGRGRDLAWGVLEDGAALHDVPAPARSATGPREPGTTGTTGTAGTAETTGTAKVTGISGTTGTTGTTVPTGASQRPQEPDGPMLPPDALGEASLILVPALAVDRSGHRLGRGAGWYDRALEWRSPEATAVAVCWPWEVTDAPLPRGPHDVPVDAVLTPDGFVPFAPVASAAPVVPVDSVASVAPVDSVRSPLAHGCRLRD